MLIPLTSVQGKHIFGLSAAIIWCVERNPQNPLSTRVITTMSDGKNMMAYEVWESPEEVVMLVAQAAGKPVPKLDYSVSEPAASASKQEKPS
jgi:hypothetical protein